MMQLINTVHGEYNENVLTDVFKHSNDIEWTVTNPPGGATVETTDVFGYEEGRSIKVSALSYADNDTQFFPTDPFKYSFKVLKTGNYIFSFRTVVPSQGNFLPEIVGSFFWDRIGGAPLQLTCPFAIGNNSFPEFAFEYDKLQTFYQSVYLTAGEEYSLGGQIDQQPFWAPGTVDIYFTGFKMEFIDDKAYNIPTYYTKPCSNGNYNTSYKEITGVVTLNNTHNTIVIKNTAVANFNLTLPDAIGVQGKVLKFVNKSAIITTIFGYGINKVDGATSYKVNPLTTVEIKSNGLDWVVITKSREYKLNRTHWFNAISLTTIPNATIFNLLTIITNATKVALGSDAGIDALNIASNKILVPWTGVPITHEIRLIGTISTGSVQNFDCQLRRSSDDSIVATATIHRTADTGKFTVNFNTYTGSATDPFVTDGFYITLENQSGGDAELIDDISLYINSNLR